MLILFDSTVEILHEKTNPSTAAKRLDDFFWLNSGKFTEKTIPFTVVKRWDFFENTSNDFYNLSIDTVPLQQEKQNWSPNIYKNHIIP